MNRSVWSIMTIMLLMVCGNNLSAQFRPKSRGEIVKHDYFTLDYNEEHEQPEWVYYILTRANVDGDTKRAGSFKADPKVKTGSASPADYKDSGYDRGHLCPAGDMKQNVEAMTQTFYMSNMSPQLPSVNRGVWNRVEAFVREQLVDTLYIVTGPVFKDNKGKIGKNGVTVPGHYYKIAYAPRNKEMIAFLVPNVNGLTNALDYITTVDSVEQLTGINFFYQLPDTLENRIESIKYTPKR
ncbi:MAG: DNA/RNA non-specific endonuclease [Marinifilaceae bacterium]